MDLIMDWDNPSERAALIDRVGPEEYSRLLQEHQEKSVIAWAGGHGIRPVATRFGRLLMVGATGSAFYRLEDAIKHGESNPVN